MADDFNPSLLAKPLDSVKNDPPFPDLFVDDFAREFRIERHLNEAVLPQLRLAMLNINQAIHGWVAQKLSLSDQEQFLYRQAVFFLCRAKLELIFTSPDDLREMAEKTKHKLQLKTFYEQEASQLLQKLTGQTINLTTQNKFNFATTSATLIGDVK